MDEILQGVGHPRLAFATAQQRSTEPGTNGSGERRTERPETAGRKGRRQNGDKQIKTDRYGNRET